METSGNIGQNYIGEISIQGLRFHGSGQYLRGTNKSASVDGIKHNLNINGMTEGPPLRISMRKAATIVIELFLNQHLIIVLSNGKHIREYP